VLLSPVQPSRGRPSSASGFPRADLSLHIISHQPDSISPDQSPFKDPRDIDAVEEQEAPLPSPDPIIIHSRVPLTRDSSPLTGPPPYQPPESPAAHAADHPSLPPDHERDKVQPDTADDPCAAALLAGDTVQSPCKVPRTLSAPVAQIVSSALALTQSESLSAAERAEDRYLARLLEQASALSSNGEVNQDVTAGSEETQTRKDS